MRHELTTRRLRKGLLLLAYFAFVPPAHADDASARAEARSHFKNGLEHVRHGELAAAIDDLESAYRASPNFAVLYDLGQAYVGVGRHADAVHAFQRFLAEGGERIDAERRKVVLELASREHARTCTIELEISPSEAEVFVDGRRLPPESLGIQDFDPGEHVIAAQAPGYLSNLSFVELGPGESSRVSLKLEHEAIDLKLPLESVPASGAPHRITSAPPPTRDREPPLTTPGTRNRDWTLGLAAGSLVLAGTTVGLFVWNTGRYRAWQNDRRNFDAMLAVGGTNATTISQSHALTDRAVGVQRVDDLTVGLAVAATAALTSAAVLWFTRSSPKGDSSAAVARHAR